MRLKPHLSIFVVCIMFFFFLFVGNAASAKEKANSELRNLGLGLPYTISAPTGEIDTGNELTDGNYGSLDFNHPSWQRHLRQQERTVTFDLGEKKSIGQVKAHFLQDTPVGIHFPEKVTISVSQNLHDWGELAEIKSEIPLFETGKTGPTALTQNYIWDGSIDGLPRGNKHAEMVYARYVQVKFTTDVWVFLDEIEILGVDGKDKNAKSLPPNNNKPEVDLGYLKPGEQTGGIHNLVLLYNGWYANGFGDWTKDKLLPYVSYVDQAGEPQDWFFDGVLFLGLQSPNKRDFMEVSIPTNKDDWQWYLDKTFAPDGDMEQLNEAAKEVATKLEEPDHKVKVILMVPYPSMNQQNFGDVDGDGKTEIFDYNLIGHDEAYRNKQKALEWYINEATEYWEAAGYSHLELSGLYWLSEKVNLQSSHEIDMIHWMKEQTEAKELAFLWMPYMDAVRSHQWEESGFGAAAMQPSYFFDGKDPSRIETAANLAKRYGMGVEIEVNEEVIYHEEWRQRYLAYLNGGIDFGYMDNAFKAYYQGGDTYYRGAYSTDPKARATYDWTYEFTKGTYLGP
ncbi:DUF4855 domain-containing protein [Bacillus niameyensis]|uniref:DUF4855 domain-containing protein n=1 Tax=Bacillus niameyensis TaxID=1522308 RepID=UPI0007848411|nr:DUF4855 domain-containing protein [Bacillus niameyensis]